MAAGADASVSGLTIAGPNAEAILLGAGSNLAAQNVTFQNFGIAGDGIHQPAAIQGSQGGGTISVQGSTFTNGFATAIVDVGFTSLTVADSTFSGGTSSASGGTIVVAAGSTGQGGRSLDHPLALLEQLAFNSGSSS